MIQEELITLPIEDFFPKANLPSDFDPKINHINRNQIVSLLFKEKDNIQKTFTNDEYLELDLTNQEIIGIKATGSTFLGHTLEDKEAMIVKKSTLPKYKHAKTEGLGNSKTLFEHI